MAPTRAFYVIGPFMGYGTKMEPLLALGNAMQARLASNPKTGTSRWRTSLNFGWL